MYLLLQTISSKVFMFFHKNFQISSENLSALLTKNFTKSVRTVFYVSRVTLQAIVFGRLVTSESFPFYELKHFGSFTNSFVIVFKIAFYVLVETF